MKKEQILKLAIQQAVKGGWNNYWDNDYDWEAMSLGIILYDKGARRGTSSSGFIGFPTIIFSHDFCKAFFGTKILDIKDLGFIPITKATKTVAWKFHLLAMVLKKEPLKYLEKFVDKKRKRK